MPRSAKTIVIIPAAGTGSRMHSATPKQYLPLGAGGQTVLQVCVGVFDPLPGIDAVYVVASAGDPVVSTLELGRAQVLYCGGATRSETVDNALRALADELEDADVVLVHDAARALVRADDVQALVQAFERAQGVAGLVLAMPLFDTVKRVDAQGVLCEDVDRNGLVRVATPQIFHYGTLRRALRAHPGHTDESSAVRAAGGRVGVLSGSPLGFKITCTADLALAQQMMPCYRNESMAMTIRVGLGYDSHRLGPDRPLILGGVAIDYPLGLVGHSDADVLLHALTDALLGAANRGNIGQLFPDTDPAYRQADSAVLLAQAWQCIARDGWSIVNIDAVIVAERPKLNAYVPAMSARIAAVLHIAPEQVSIKPKTNEKMGFEGEGLGMSARVIVLLNKEPDSAN